MNNNRVTPVIGPLDPSANVVIPARMLPGFNTTVAVQRGVEKNLLFRTWGGIGDQICAEPTIRHALKMFRDCEISLASECPELFSHLQFKKVYNLKKETPDYTKYFSFETITPPDDSNIVWQFMNHMITNCVDFPSLCALRLQLPIEEKEVRLPDIGYNPLFSMDNKVIIHAGKHWQSKTFPKAWWDEVLKELDAGGAIPVLIGANTDDNRGTVDVDTYYAVDLRNKLSLLESISLLKKSKVLLTNDSSPLHMAVDSECWIGFIASCKHPDMITHWRRGQWGYKMRNFGKTGIWDVIDYCPNKMQKVEVENIGDEFLASILPDPKYFAGWALEKLEIKK